MSPPLSTEDTAKINTAMEPARSLLAVQMDDVLSRRSMLKLVFGLLPKRVVLADLGQAFLSVAAVNDAVGCLQDGEINGLYDLCQTAARGKNDWASCCYKLKAISMRDQESTIQPDIETLRNAFTSSPFVGNAHNAFKSYLTEIDREFDTGNSSQPKKTYYGKFCSVVQSSGTGTDTRVLYMNLRDRKDTSSYPPRDDVPANLLSAGKLSKEDYERRCCVFFAAIFDVVNKELSKEVSGDPFLAWQKKFHPWFTTSRSTFFKGLGAKFQELLSEEGPDDHMHTTPELNSHDGVPMTVEQEATCDTISTSTSSSSTQKIPAPELDLHEGVPMTVEHEATGGTISASTSSSSTQEIPAPDVRGEGIMRSSYSRLVKNHNDIFDNANHEPRLVIVLDEAACLRKLEDSLGGSYVPSDVLCRVISSYSNAFLKPIWVVFASTESRIADFAAPNSRSDSLRLLKGGQMLFRPFIEVGFDHYAPPLGEVDMEKIASLEYLALFGRPLWKHSLHTGIPGLLRFATAKLLRSPNFSRDDKIQPLIVLSQRFALDMVFSHPKSTKFLDKSVASHLRICTSISKDRLWKTTAYPSEPLLSHCAAVVMWKSPGDMQSIFNKLQDKISDGMVDKGKSGELGSRVCTLLAKDVCLHSNTSAQSYSQSVSVIDWLETMFGGTVVPVEHAQDLRRIFAGWEINFSHWVRMATKIGDQRPSFNADEWVKRHYIRSSAVQCVHHQTDVDKMIPMRCGNDYSQIYISDKLSVDPTPHLYNQIHRTDRGIHTENGKPWIVIVLDMGVDSSHDGPLKVLVDVGEPDLVQAKRTRSTIASTCWRIYAPGKTRKTYPFLGTTKFPLENIFNSIVMQEFEPPPYEEELQPLRDKLEFGLSTEDRHMKWEEKNEKSV